MYSERSMSMHSLCSIFFFCCLIRPVVYFFSRSTIFQQILILLGRKGIVVEKVRDMFFPFEFDFRDGKESRREVCIVYAPLERRRHLERVFCALMYRYAATE